MQPNVELIAIGNELLVGQVLDSNSHWLIKNLTASGATVRRVQMIRDEYDEIEATFKAAFARKPRLIITTGGLGPTDDDLTARAIAQTFGVTLHENAIAIEMLTTRYAHLASIRPGYSAELNDARRKMALFPLLAEPLANSDGAAPAICIDVDTRTTQIVPAGSGDCTVVCLPGVPKEMKEIFQNSMQHVLARTVGAGGYIERNIVLDRGDESRIAGMLQTCQERHSQVYIKSRGQLFADIGQRLTVVLSIGGPDLAHVRALEHVCEQDVLFGLKELGYDVLRVTE